MAAHPGGPITDTRFAGRPTWRRPGRGAPRDDLRRLRGPSASNDAGPLVKGHCETTAATAGLGLRLGSRARRRTSCPDRDARRVTPSIVCAKSICRLQSRADGVRRATDVVAQRWRRTRVVEGQRDDPASTNRDANGSRRSSRVAPRPWARITSGVAAAVLGRQVGTTRPSSWASPEAKVRSMALHAAQRRPAVPCRYSSSVKSRDRIRNRTPSGASSEKPAPAARDHVDGQVGVRPVGELRLRHPERDRPVEADVEVAEQDVGLAGDEVAVPGSTSGSDPSQQPPDWWNISGPCCLGEAAEQLRRLAGDVDLEPAAGRQVGIMAQKKPSASGE